MDAKVALINTGATILLGYSAFLGKWWIENIPKTTNSWACWEKVGYLLHIVFLVLIGIFGLMIFIKSKRVWFPNHSPLKIEDFTALFPEWDGTRLKKESVDVYLRNVAEGSMTNDRTIAGEYAIQLRVLGNILYNKIQAGQEMVPWFKRLYWAIGAETLAVLFCVSWRFWNY